MPRMTAIACDQCGKTETGTGYSIRRTGWEKGPEKGTFFCDAPACRAARQAAEAAATAKRGQRHE